MIKISYISYEIQKEKIENTFYNMICAHYLQTFRVYILYRKMKQCTSKQASCGQMFVISNSVHAMSS